MAAWTDTLRFRDLLTELVDKTSVYRVAKYTGRDKSAINGWLNGGKPNDPSDVGLVVRCALDEDIDLTSYQTFSPIWDLGTSDTYEERMASRPPDFSWLAAAGSPPAFNTRFCGLHLDTPIGISAGPLTGNATWTRCLLDLQFGFSTFKTRRSGPKRSWDPPQLAFVREMPSLVGYEPGEPPEVLVSRKRNPASGSIPHLVNSIGVFSESPEQWAAEYEQIRAHARGGFVGISILADGDHKADFHRDFATVLSAALCLHPPFVECNWFCPNLERRGALFSDLEFMSRLFQEAQTRAHRTGTLFTVKLPALQELLFRKAVRTVAPYVDAILVRNTMPVRPVCLDRDGNRYSAFPGRTVGGLSGPDTYPFTLKSLQALVRLREELKASFEIIVGGGVSKPAHVMELLDNGAGLVQVCTAAIFDPFLAWKTNFHLDRNRSVWDRPGELDAVQLPRDRIEQQAYADLEDAVTEFGKRGSTISHQLVKTVWNEWMKSRSGSSVGMARRPKSAPTKGNWITLISKAISGRGTM